MKKFYSIFAIASMMLTSVISFSSCNKDDDMYSRTCPAEDLVNAVNEVSKTVDNTNKAIDLETYWEGNAICGSTAMKVYLKFEVIAFGSGQGREIYKIKGEDKVYSEKKFTFAVKEGALTLTYNNDNSTVVISKGSWDINNKGSYENKLYASFTSNGQAVSWNGLSKMTYWSDTSLLEN